LAFAKSEAFESGVLETEAEHFSDSTPHPKENAHFYDLTPDARDALLADKSNRISDLFSVPRGIRHMTGFWLEIYAKYSSLQTVLYDREHPNFVYDVVDLRDLFKKGSSPVVIELTGKKRIQNKLNEIRSAIDQISKNSSVRFKPGSAGAKLVRYWGRKPKIGWAKVRENLRTQTGQRDRVIQGITHAERFIPAMEAIFKDFNLPVELTRLPLVESSFNLKAVSKADAVGVWQFLERSALEYMKVDEKNKIDERLSPIKSTYGAAKMFVRNYRLLGDYALAIIAYNHGQRNLIKLRHKYRTENISALLRSENSPLGYASRNYYAEFLAMLIAEEYRDELFGLPLTREVEHVSIVKLKAPSSMFDVAAHYRLSLQEIKIFNPDIFDLKRTLPVGTRVVIPRKVDQAFVEKEKSRSPSSEAPQIAGEVINLY